MSLNKRCNPFFAPLMQLFVLTGAIWLAAVLELWYRNGFTLGWLFHFLDSPLEMSVFDYSDFMILAGSFMQGSQENNDISFIGAVSAGLGMNIQFEETRLSITRIVLVSAAGYYFGKLFHETRNE